MTMKKTISLILALALLFCLSACGKNSADVSSNETSLTESTTSVVSSSNSENSSSEASSSETSSKADSSKTSSTASVSSSTVSKKDYSNSTETINILVQDNAVDYKGKIITPYAILNSDYSIHAYYENTWECRRNISVYDGNLFYYDIVAEKYQTRSVIFTCDENGKNVKEVVKNAIFGIYTIYKGRIYYLCEKHLCSSNIDGTDERKESYLEGFSQPSFAVVKDSVLYCWIFKDETPCIIKFDPKTKKLEVVKRYPNPTSYFWRSPLLLQGNDIYYYSGNILRKVNFSGEDPSLLDTTTYPQPYIINKHVNVCGSGVFVATHYPDSKELTNSLFAFNDLTTEKTPPETIYKVIKNAEIQNLSGLYICQSKDKIILFLSDK